MNIKDLENTALEMRKSVFRTVCLNKAGHLASSLSSIEILVALYFGNILQYDTNKPDWDKRDRFIMSKGHAALALYYILAKAGYYDKVDIDTFCKEGTIFGGLSTYGKIPGIEMTSGSLGHGLSFAAGIAVTAKYIQNDRYHIYALLGDGELQEGEIWEAALFISHNNLTNLTIIIDNNGMQATGKTENIVGLSDLTEKWGSFGFHVIEADGHDIKQLLESMKMKTEIPKVIIANTVKGKGLSFLENKMDCHYKIPSEEEMAIGLHELGMKGEDLK